MADQEIIDLLTQIRDLQRQHAENYHQALDQQRKAIRLQRGALIVGPIVILVMLFAFLLLYLLMNRT
jgi:CHASE3 domain sensor protein